jgi:cystathionine beta-lyase/cystathionine gamma-synthase
VEPALPRPAGGFATRAVHGATVSGPGQRPLGLPIVPASTWATEEGAELGRLLADSADGYVYGRYDNPTNTGLHTVVASLHEAEAAWSAASGTAAIVAALDVVGGSGRIAASDRLYGGTHALLERQAARAGWQVDRVDVTDPDAVAAALTDDHTVLYVETISNPATVVADIATLAGICDDRDVALVVDNTFASPYLCRPLERGATLVVESATKFLSGHSDVVAGVVAGPRHLIAAVRTHVYELGASLGPFDAFLVARGIQTLPLRMRAAGDNALAIARLLADADLPAVYYPGLADHPQHALAERQFAGRGFGAVLSFDLPDRDVAEVFADACHVLQRAVSLGGTHSLVLHPGSTTHRQLTDDGLIAAGINPGTIRLSIGVEDVTDLIADIERALAVAATH